jgi:hypothetical protein
MQWRRHPSAGTFSLIVVSGLGGGGRCRSYENTGDEGGGLISGRRTSIFGLRAEPESEEDDELMLRGR